jgi:hypothetical protein
MGALAGCTSKSMPPPLGNGGTHPPIGGGGGTTNDASAEGGVATVLLTGQTNVRAVATDSSWVYFATASDGATLKSGTVRRVSKLGGQPQDLATNLDSPYAAFLFGGELYYSTPDPTSVSGTIYAVAAAGGTPRIVVSGTGAASWLANDGQFVYFPTTFGATGASIERAALGGGTSQIVAQVTGALVPYGIIVSQGWVYFAATGVGGGIYRAAVTGGGAEPLDQESASFSGITLAAGRLWVTDDIATHGRLVSIPIAGGTPRVDVTDIDHPTHIVTDGTWIYFTSYGSAGAVAAFSTVDGTLKVLAVDLAFPWDLAVDDAVYVGVIDGVIRVPKP